ncbi:MAG: hypothetical protein MZU84_03695 [Sphingobacterium sp.]|nr:hypothetical protein [Sphingobacterium sp.]
MLRQMSGEASLSTGALDFSDVGNYTINTLLGTLSSNLGYSFNLVNGTITINPATLTVAIDNKSRLYGNNNPAFTASIYRIEKSSGMKTYSLWSTPANILSNVGNYNINLGYTTSNYDVTTNTGSLIINPAPLSVSANNALLKYMEMLTLLSQAKLFRL